MGWIQRLLPNRVNKAVEQAARDVATKSQPVVSERLRAAVSTMSLSEARGYVRAKAGAPVRKATEHAVQQAPLLTAELFDRVARVATEKVVHCIVRDLLTQPVAAERARKAA